MGIKNNDNKQINLSPRAEGAGAGDFSREAPGENFNFTALKIMSDSKIEFCSKESELF